jgi:hypothetical protein
MIRFRKVAERAIQTCHDCVFFGVVDVMRYHAVGRAGCLSDAALWGLMY